MTRSRYVVPTELAIDRALNTLLEHAHWPKTLAVKNGYTRRQDDTDGETDHSHDLTVSLSVDGDAWIATGYGLPLRFRTDMGGGMSQRTRNALLVLAEAIRRDNADRPQRQ